MEDEKVLYIIGNGFDRAHGLKTDYKDFIKYCEKNQYNGNKELIERCLDDNGDKLWTQFEQSLGELDFHNIIEEAGEDYEESEFSYTKMFAVKESICDLFKSWIKSIEIHTVPMFKFTKDDYFITFNYTNTLEKIYHIDKSQIYHIHGEINDIIFGHNNCIKLRDRLTDVHEGYEEMPNNIFNLNSMACNILEEFKKPIKDIIKKFSHSKFYSQIKNIKKKIILGHSINDIDLSYYRFLFDKLNFEIIECTYYKGDDKYKFYRKLSKIKNSRARLLIFPIKNYMQSSLSHI